MRYLRSVFALLLASSAASAADITIYGLDGSTSLVGIVGTLEADDADQFKTKTAYLPKAIIAFNSDGGSLIAGILIGETIRLRNFTTFVPDDFRCASACALAWL